MNTLLWALQGLLAVLFVVGGATKIFMFEQVADQVASNSALPRELWPLIGIFEVLCALGLVIPGVLRKATALIPLAGIGLAIEGILFAVLHASYAEYSPMMFSLILGGFAAVVAYGRLALKPL